MEGVVGIPDALERREPGDLRIAVDPAALVGPGIGVPVRVRAEWTLRLDDRDDLAAPLDVPLVVRAVGPAGVRADVECPRAAVASSSTREIAPPSAVIEKLPSPGSAMRAAIRSSASEVTSSAFRLLMNDRVPHANARSWAVWTSRYGALPIAVVSGSAARRPAVSSSTSSRAPLWFHARNVALSAAEEGVRVSRSHDDPGDGIQAALRFATESGDGILLGPDAALGGDADTIEITVTGEAVSLLPGLTLTISQTARAPRERFTVPGDQ